MPDRRETGIKASRDSTQSPAPSAHQIRPADLSRLRAPAGVIPSNHISANNAVVVFLVFWENEPMDDDLLTSGEVARMLGVSRQHVVDLCDRGEVEVVRTGKHRRIPRREVTRRVQTLTREQERSLWLHRAVVGQMMLDPGGVLSRARDNLLRRREVHRGAVAQAYFDVWSETLDRGVDAVVETLLSRAPAACELRQNSPFAGVLEPDDRLRVLEAFREHWRSHHDVALVGV